MKPILSKLAQANFHIEETGGVFQFINNFAPAFSLWGKTAGLKCSFGVFATSNGYTYEFTPRDERTASFDLLLKKMARNPRWLTEFYCQWRQKRAEFLKFCQTVEKKISDASNIELNRYYQDYF